MLHRFYFFYLWAYHAINHYNTLPMKVLFVYSQNMILPPPFIESQRISLIRNNILVDNYKIDGNGIFGYLKNIFTLRKYILDNNF